MLYPNGLLDGEEATCHPSFVKDDMPFKKIQERVVVSNKCITSRGPGTAIEFSLKLVEKLVSVEKAA